MHVIELDTVTSTMDVAAELIAAGTCLPWTTVIARRQTGGQGRHDREWESADGQSLLMTVIAPISIRSEKVGLIALATGVAVAAAIEEFGLHVALKWPNDLYVHGRKLGGVLVKTHLDAPITARIGVGINLLSVTPQMSDTAICLADVMSAPPQPRELAECAVSKLRNAIEQLERDDSDAVLTAWMKRAMWLGEMVTVTTELAVSGILKGVDATGRAILETGEGDIHLAVGDVLRGPRPA